VFVAHRQGKRASAPLIDNLLTFSRMERNERTFEFDEVGANEVASPPAAADQGRRTDGRCRQPAGPAQIAKTSLIPWPTATAFVILWSLKTMNSPSPDGD